MKRLIPAVLAVFLISCSNAPASPSQTSVPEETALPQETVSADEGFVEGQMGEVMHTAFFDFTVNSAGTVHQYEDYEAGEGYELLNVNLTVRNALDTELTMYDTDFQITWSDEEDGWTVPLTYLTEISGRNLLKTEYILRRNEEITGDLVFEVPEGETFFCLSYLEQFDNDTEGDLFGVYFETEE